MSRPGGEVGRTLSSLSPWPSRSISFPVSLSTCHALVVPLAVGVFGALQLKPRVGDPERRRGHYVDRRCRKGRNIILPRDRVGGLIFLRTCCVGHADVRNGAHLPISLRLAKYNQKGPHDRFACHVHQCAEVVVDIEVDEV